MGWSGYHIKTTEETIREIIPKRACRLCVVLFRAYADHPEWWGNGDPRLLMRDRNCPRCGLNYRQTSIAVQDFREHGKKSNHSHSTEP